MPSAWSRWVVTPVHKHSSADTHEPSNYRGKHITHAVYNWYWSIITVRLSAWVEENKYLVDEQMAWSKIGVLLLICLLQIL